MENFMRVASSTDVKQLSASILKRHEENQNVQLFAIGAGSISQCVKALSRARYILLNNKKELTYYTEFYITKIHDVEKTGIIFNVKIL
jgi:stage V sporulation protein SpoVS